MHFRHLGKYAVIIVFIVLAMLSLYGCKEVTLNLNGRLLVPMAIDVNGKHNIFQVNLDDSTNAKIYFEHENYDEIRFPFFKGNVFMCVGKNVKENYYALLKIDGNQVTEVMKDKDKIFFPSFVGDSKIVYMKQENNNAYLYIFDISSNTAKRAYEGIVDIESKPIVASDGSILFASNDSDNFMIKQIKKDGTIQDIVKGGCPIWLKEGKEIIYYTSWSLRTYDLEEKKDRIIKKDIILIETPVISPDGKFLAFYEHDKTVKIGSETAEFLSVMTVDGKKKMHVKAYSKARRILGNNGIVWVQ